MIRNQDIKNVVMTDSIKDCNQFLKEGFVILDKNKKMDGGFNFLLGLANKEE